MVKKKWIVFVAGRFLKAKKRRGGVNPSFFSIIGLTVGVLTLISVLAVMNGFQLGFIEDILEIGSYHVRIIPGEDEAIAPLVEDLSGLEGVGAAVPFVDIQTMVESSFSSMNGCNIRGADRRRMVSDPGWLSQVEVKEEVSFTGEGGGLENPEEGTVWIGNVLASSIGVSAGDQVSFLSMAGDSFSGLRPKKVELSVSLVLSTGYYEYDSAFVFASLDDIETISDGKERTLIGIKLQDRWRDRQFIEKLESFIESGAIEEVISWRSFNKAFFGALRMEKLAMILILGVIFLVVGVNIKHSLERSVWEKRRAIGLLRSIGATPKDIRKVFLIDGLLIGLLGGGTGLLLGLGIANNINELFSLVEGVINGSMALLNLIISPFAGPGHANFAIFSSSYFYMQEVPSRVMFHEAYLIFLFALFSSIAAAWAASRRVDDFDPAEILRYE